MVEDDSEMTTKQKFARGTGIASVVVAIIAAAGAAGYNLNISKTASATSPEFDASQFVTRDEFVSVRRDDRQEYLATVKEIRDDISTIKDHLIKINMSRSERIHSETAQQ